eukprot:symbB.v1.2.034540.t1/scaffold4476.1/size41083/3
METSTENTADNGAGQEPTANGELSGGDVPDADAGHGMQGEDGGGKGNKRRRKGGDGEKQYDLVGTIRMFNADKGWGFIDGDTGCKDIFLHAKHFVGKPPNYWIGHKMQTKDKHVAPKVTEGPVRVVYDMSLTSQGKPQEELEDDDGDDRPRRLSPTCETCGSTVAARLGLSVCILCNTPVSRR